jgi:hypothetical protein
MANSTLSTLGGFLSFPAEYLQRFRSVAGYLCSVRRNAEMDNMPVEDWLVRVSGRGVYRKVYKPLRRLTVKLSMSRPSSITAAADDGDTPGRDIERDDVLSGRLYHLIGITRTCQIAWRDH